MSRRRSEFSKETKRAALKRSGGLCEAVGPLYGLAPGARCNADLAYGVHFDHVNLEANSHDNSLSNCAATCPRCNLYKARKHDTPRAAKTVRQQDKHRGIRKSPTMKSRNTFRPYQPNVKYLDRL